MTNIATPFKLNNKEWESVISEYNIHFQVRNSQENLITFAETYPDHRINIQMDKIDMSLLSILNKIHDNIALRLMNISDIQLIPELKEKNIKFFLDYTLLPAVSNTSLDYILSLGVSDVYIADDMCYNLRYASETIRSYDAKVRLILNQINITVPYLDQAKTPWFSPDSFLVIEPYIDVVEFDCGEPYDWRIFGVCYRAWFKRHAWHGNLNDLIEGLDIDVIEDSFLGEGLIRYKIHCMHHCTNLNRKCDRCDKTVQLSCEMAMKNRGFNKESGQNK